MNLMSETIPNRPAAIRTAGLIPCAIASKKGLPRAKNGNTTSPSPRIATAIVAETGHGDDTATTMTTTEIRRKAQHARYPRATM